MIWFGLMLQLIGCGIENVRNALTYRSITAENTKVERCFYIDADGDVLLTDVEILPQPLYLQ